MGNYIKEALGFGTVVSVIAYALHYWAGFARETDLAWLAVTVVILLAVAVTFGLRLAMRRGAANLDVNLPGHWSAFTIIAIAVTFAALGHFSYPMISGRSQPMPAPTPPAKPQQITLKKPKTLDQLTVARLIPFQIYFTVSSPQSFKYFVETESVDAPSAEFRWSFGPGDAIESAFVFLVPDGPAASPITFLAVGPNDAGDFSVTVPAATEKFHLLVIYAAKSKSNLYGGRIE
jgi:hypothetical protein